MSFLPGSASSLNCSIDITIFTEFVLEVDGPKPAPRHAHLFVQFQDPIGEGIAVAKIVEEPAIQFFRAQGGLNFRNTGRGSLLCVHKRREDEAKSKCCEEKRPRRIHENVEVTRCPPPLAIRYDALQRPRLFLLAARALLRHDEICLRLAIPCQAKHREC